ncbi:MAG: hypothetical protein J0I99_07580 [Devosia sp.]|uniref:hypothetical protein n=1 Tax=Devosia sp. TaxID=1871048 RepID=UPI001AC9778E|nr:hypothetical protein [Devosia sp.]MBN9315580.1 hypothetical protein [Devosia sp.]
MNWLLDFQRSLREPVYAFLGSYWPLIAIVALVALGWYVGAITRQRDAAGGNAAPDDDADAGDGGGD